MSSSSKLPRKLCEFILPNGFPSLSSLFKHKNITHNILSANIHTMSSSNKPPRQLSKLESLPTEVLENIFLKLLPLPLPHPKTLEEVRNQNYGGNEHGEDPYEVEKVMKKRWTVILTSKRIYAVSIPVVYRHVELQPEGRTPGRLMENMSAVMEREMGAYVHSLDVSSCEQMTQAVQVMPNIETLKFHIPSQMKATIDLTEMRGLTALECSWHGAYSHPYAIDDAQLVLPKSISTFIVKETCGMDYPEDTIKNHLSQLPNLKHLDLDLFLYSVDVLKILPESARLSSLSLEKNPKASNSANSLSSILSTHPAFCKSIVVLNLGGIYNMPTDLPHLSQLLASLPTTVRYLDISRNYLVRYQVPDLRRIARQVQELRIGTPSVWKDGRGSVKLQYADMLRAEDVLDIILGESAVVTGPSTISELDISTMEQKEQYKLIKSRLMGGSNPKLRTVTVGKKAFGLELLAWAWWTKWKVTEGFTEVWWVERLI